MGVLPVDRALPNSCAKSRLRMQKSTIACLFSAGVCLDASQTCKQHSLASWMIKGKCVCLCQGKGTARPDTKSVFFAKVDLHSCAAAGDAVGHTLTATGSLEAYIYSWTSQQAAAVLRSMINIPSAPQIGTAMLNKQVYSPFAYLLPDTFIADTLHNPIDTALIQGHKLRGHQVAYAPIDVHPEL